MPAKIKKRECRACRADLSAKAVRTISPLTKKPTTAPRIVASFVTVLITKHAGGREDSAGVFGGSKSTQREEIFCYACARDGMRILFDEISEGM